MNQIWNTDHSWNDGKTNHIPESPILPFQIIFLFNTALCTLQDGRKNKGYREHLRPESRWILKKRAGDFVSKM